MIPYLKAQIAEAFTPETQRAIVSEYLQMRILHSLQSVGAMIPLAFHGGTALRILYQLPRYSEDLDFALERQSEQYDFRKYLTTIQRDMTAETYVIGVFAYYAPKSFTICCALSNNLRLLSYLL